MSTLRRRPAPTGFASPFMIETIRTPQSCQSSTRGATRPANSLHWDQSKSTAGHRPHRPRDCSQARQSQVIHCRHPSATRSICWATHSLTTLSCPGQSLDLTLFWSPRGRPTQDYTVFLHLLDSLGQLRGQADSPPDSGRYPTSVWDAGEFIADLHTLSIAPDLPAGEYTVAIGLYDPQTGHRLPIIDQNGKVTGDLVIISGLVVGGE